MEVRIRGSGFLRIQIRTKLSRIRNTACYLGPIWHIQFLTCHTIPIIDFKKTNNEIFILELKKLTEDLYYTVPVASKIESTKTHDELTALNKR